MILTGYAERDYRNRAVPAGLAGFTARVEQTDLWIAAVRDLSKEAVASIRRHRRGLEEHVRQRPDFERALRPWRGEVTDNLVLAMVQAAQTVGVGPMAAVAGAIAEAVARDLAQLSGEVMVENGGDLYLVGAEKRTVGIWAGASPLSGKVGIKITPGEGLAVCTSSGTVGPSLSFGRADAAMVVSRCGALADAAATELGNRVSSAEDVGPALQWVRTIPGVLGAALVIGEVLGAIGEVSLTRI